jgi:asparagine synthetase B (glutamine-hydrolysing)
VVCRTISVAVNGEIYNHKALKAKILEKHPNRKFNTQSDCEVSESHCEVDYEHNCELVPPPA